MPKQWSCFKILSFSVFNLLIDFLFNKNHKAFGWEKPKQKWITLFDFEFPKQGKASVKRRRKTYSMIYSQKTTSQDHPDLERMKCVQW